ncbi:hypothetical protein NP233_g280 [Leucocoprinus birnbaumii]|uniref:Uncharacterized protein n=1 Tax=Leucocoprinus birnbaumii TaxID=56174 RepID=A0AAD5YVX7_9AGAR|nr:hypothetical protein NP233_g280 [Leucocoprinus birnbaumii]
MIFARIKTNQGTEYTDGKRRFTSIYRFLINLVYCKTFGATPPPPAPNTVKSSSKNTIPSSQTNKPLASGIQTLATKTSVKILNACN